MDYYIIAREFDFEGKVRDALREYVELIQIKDRFEVAQRNFESKLNCLPKPIQDMVMERITFETLKQTS